MKKGQQARFLRSGVARPRRARGPVLSAAELEALARKPADWPKTCYLVCATTRAGTSLLAGLLSSTGLVGYADEYFHPENEPDWAAHDYGAYVSYIRRRRSVNGVFGAKLAWWQLQRLLPKLRVVLRKRTRRLPRSDRRVLEAVFPSPRYVWIRRDDVVAQAVSWSKAAQTGLWSSHVSSGTGQQPVFDFEEIDRRVAQLNRWNAAWARWFAANGVEPFRVVFEQLVADEAGIAGEVLRALGLAVPEGVPIQAKTEPQDGAFDEWIARYREEASRRASTRR